MILESTNDIQVDYKTVADSFKSVQYESVLIQNVSYSEERLQEISVQLLSDLNP